MWTKQKKMTEQKKSIKAMRNCEKCLVEQEKKEAFEWLSILKGSFSDIYSIFSFRGTHGNLKWRTKDNVTVNDVTADGDIKTSLCLRKKMYTWADDLIKKKCGLLISCCQYGAVRDVNKGSLGSRKNVFLRKTIWRFELT